MKRRWIIPGIFALDVTWVVLSLGLSYGLRYSAFAAYPPSGYKLVILTGVAVWTVLFRMMRLDGFDGGWRMLAIFSRLAAATMLLMACVLSIAYLHQVYYSRLLLGYFTLLLFLGFMAIRGVVYQFLRSRHRRWLTRRVVLVGNDRVTREFAVKILRHPELLYDTVGILDLLSDGPARGASSDVDRQTLSSIDVLEVMRKHSVHELIVLEHTPGIEFQTFVARCRSLGMCVNVLPHGYELYTSKVRLVDIGGLPLISLEGPVNFPLAAAVKRAMDLGFLVLLTVPAVVITGLAALMLVRYKGSAFRREIRIGKDGRPFWMHRLNVDRQPKDYPRYEQVLRGLSISELPQLWNVLRGDMSLVGPRPESPERVGAYSQWLRERLKLKPGMTGLAQVNGLRDEHPSEDKATFDLQYPLEWSPILDITLLLQTFATLAKRWLRERNVASPINLIDHAVVRCAPQPGSVEKVADSI